MVRVCSTSECDILSAAKSLGFAFFSKLPDHARCFVRGNLVLCASIVRGNYNKSQPDLTRSCSPTRRNFTISMSIFCFDFWYVNFKYLALLDAKYIQVNLLSTHRSVVEMGRGTLWYVSIFLFTTSLLLWCCFVDHQFSLNFCKITASQRNHITWMCTFVIVRVTVCVCHDVCVCLYVHICSVSLCFCVVCLCAYRISFRK